MKKKMIKKRVSGTSRTGKAKGKNSKMVHARPRKKLSGAAQLTGVYRSNARGFGFVIPAEKFREKYSEDIFVPRLAGNGAMDRDTVRISLREARGMKTGMGASNRLALEGEVEEILERAADRIIGTLRCEQVQRCV